MPTSLQSPFEVSLEPPVLQAQQHKFPQPLLIRHVLQTLHQFRCLYLDLLQPLNASFVVRGPKLKKKTKQNPRIFISKLLHGI